MQSAVAAHAELYRRRRRLADEGGEMLQLSECLIDHALAQLGRSRRGEDLLCEALVEARPALGRFARVGQHARIHVGHRRVRLTTIV